MARDYTKYRDGEAFNGTIGTTWAESEPSWPVGADAPEDAPNVVFIVLDDLGYAQLGCYGGLGGRLETPNIDALAAGGLRYRNFHTTALCGPTRAALLTGRNHHSVGVGTIVERATGFPGYNGRLPRDAAMVPKVLGENGYATYCVGKWHLTPDEHNGPTGPFNRWPVGMGFDRFYGFLPGETDQWHPDLWEDNHRTDAPDRPDYHLTEDLTDRAIEWLTAHQAVDEDRPFMLHFATGAMHSPHHVASSYIEAYRGRFDDGWDVIREETFARQLELGVVPQGTDLPARNRGVPVWADLTDDERELFARQMEVYAGFLTHTDEHIGRLLDHLRANDQFDNTLIFLLSDNGASAEGGRDGLLSEISYFNGLTDSLDEMSAALGRWGDDSTYPHYALGWAYAGNTPQQWYKSFVHEGGTRDPLIVSWPTSIGARGEVRDQFHHVVDIAGTVYDAIGIDPPAAMDGVTQRPLEGEAMNYSFDDGEAPTPKESQYFEMFAHRALWADGWKAVTMHPGKAAKPRIPDPDFEVREGRFDEDVWELYHLADDFSEAHDLAATHPDKLAELQQRWHEDAQRYQVYPLDDRLIERMIAAKPRVTKNKDTYVYRSPLRLPRSVSPSVINRSHHIEAEITVTAGDHGAIVSNGGLNGGYALVLLDGHLTYVSNFLGKQHHVIRAGRPAPEGDVSILLDWVKTDLFAGDVTLWQNGEPVGAGHVPISNPATYAVNEGLEIGSDTGVAVWPRYRSPFEFTGRIREVRLHTKGPAHHDAEAESRRATYQQ
jgi:arylsulfatase A-like enzyme